MTRVLLLALASGLTVVASAAPIPEEDDAAEMARVYGTWVNPNRDSKFTLTGDTLRVKLPAGGTSYYWGGKAKGSAPRALKEVEGDFDAVARVSASFPEWKKSNSGQPSVRGGLMAEDGGKELIVFLWCLGWVNGKPEGILHLDLGDNRIRMRGRTFEKAADSAYVRFTRTDKTVVTGWSRDGKNWNYFAPTPVGWGPKVKAGIIAESGLDDPVDVTFDRYSLTQPKKGPEGTP